MPSLSLARSSSYKVSAWGTFSGRRISAFNTPKTTAFAPMPSAKVTMATAVKPGDLRSMRSANRTSRREFSMNCSPPSAR